MHKTTCKLIVLSLAAMPAVSMASGFALLESSASNQGTAFAGTAVAAENASTIFFNPAAMTLLQSQQISGAFHTIDYKALFNDGNDTNNDGGDAGGLNLVPSMYYALPIYNKIWFGLGINAPFGLKTEYESNWVGRPQGVTSELKSININPSIAVQVNDQLSLGFGLDALYLKANISSVPNPASTNLLTVKGDDWAWGFNLGLLYQWDKSIRIGFAYRSKIKEKLRGEANFSLAPNLNSGASSTITLPDNATLSLYKQLNQNWSLLADVSWTGWSTFKELKVLKDTPPVLTPTPENWKDTWRYAVGAHYQWNPATKVRMGIGYDQTPVPNSTFRTPRIPDQDRLWVALGVGYKLTKNDTLDFAYSHLFVRNADINNPGTTPPATTVTGIYKAHVDIFGLQYTHGF